MMGWGSMGTGGLAMILVWSIEPPGVSGDSDRWEGWSHARRQHEAVPA
jgi:hypothetical protein